MRKSYEYILKVNAISLHRMGKHPTVNSNNFNKEERELLIDIVVEVMKQSDAQIELEFNNMSMSHIHYPTHDYSLQTNREPNDLYDDDFSLFLFKD